jgi:hypothetical protein
MGSVSAKPELTRLESEVRSVKTSEFLVGAVVKVDSADTASTRGKAFTVSGQGFLGLPNVF